MAARIGSSASYSNLAVDLNVNLGQVHRDTGLEQARLIAQYNGAKDMGKVNDFATLAMDNYQRRREHGENQNSAWDNMVRDMAGGGMVFDLGGAKDGEKQTLIDKEANIARRAVAFAFMDDLQKSAHWVGDEFAQNNTNGWSSMIDGKALPQTPSGMPSD